jgi:hypothetical protein
LRKALETVEAETLAARAIATIPTDGRVEESEVPIIFGILKHFEIQFKQTLQGFGKVWLKSIVLVSIRIKGDNHKSDTE